MQPARPGLADATSILGILENPTGREFDAGKAIRGVLAPPEEHGMEPIMGHIGMFYTNNVGTSGVAPETGNWDHLDSAAHRFEMSLVVNANFPLLLFPTSR